MIMVNKFMNKTNLIQDPYMFLIENHLQGQWHCMDPDEEGRGLAK